MPPKRYPKINTFPFISFRFWLDCFSKFSECLRVLVQFSILDIQCNRGVAGQTMWWQQTGRPWLPFPLCPGLMIHTNQNKNSVVLMAVMPSKSSNNYYGDRGGRIKVDELASWRISVPKVSLVLLCGNYWCISLWFFQTSVEVRKGLM